ncbi:MAG TPA: hypothetical protein PLY70_06210 [Saprospiraceae bacterium]|nr:hypothetical protein [Saprospiraceae bacterium]HPN71626.1 hypothetical protein [Saprospiraceae bacterium]
MLLKILILSCLILANIHISLAQDSQFGALANAQSARDELSIAISGDMKNAYTFGNKYKGILGSPFLNQDWQKAIICLKRDSLIIDRADVKVKFDVYSNELWIMHKRDSSIINSNDIHWFEIGDPISGTYKKFPSVNSGKPNLFYQEIFNVNGVKLIKQISKKLIKADFVDKGMYTIGQPYDRFEEKTEYFFSNATNEFQELKLNTKDFEKFVEKPYKKSFSEFLQQQNLKGKITEKEAVLILSYVSR